MRLLLAEDDRHILEFMKRALSQPETSPSSPVNELPLSYRRQVVHTRGGFCR